MSAIPTNQGELSDRQIISSLMYSSYASNRDQGMKPERLALYFADSEAMERRYQRQQDRQAKAINP